MVNYDDVKREGLREFCENNLNRLKIGVFSKKSRIYIYTVVLCRGILQELLHCDRVTMIGLLVQDVFEVLLPCRNRK
jgi:hypothetical protein